uniref:NADH-ubiquinone oxidoreductase chain 6 n=1 Tax=Rotunda rotundapex TaxID=2528347 RepID=A0A650G8S6_9NEOP|nr:NADH dehydrogenase subunit 6 [Rotunda rotundapex]QGW14829.1 NADH dehydrogenase subunit 6 [Rotunda rotundapex]WAR64278.1 NADH dehydrogenase subunit 6 [Rotunda rotundapex]
MKMTLAFLMTVMTSIMYFMNHPLSMGVMILSQTLLMCLITGMLIKTYWFSYIFFLIFLGGLLVLFIYVSSIASNELFSINKIKPMNIIMLFMMMFLIFQLKWNNLTENNLEMNNFTNMMFFNNENKINLNKLYNNQTSFLTTMLIIYLFINLVAVVKITNIFYGPLRSTF